MGVGWWGGEASEKISDAERRGEETSPPRSILFLFKRNGSVICFAVNIYVREAVKYFRNDRTASILKNLLQYSFKFRVKCLPETLLNCLRPDPNKYRFINFPLPPPRLLLPLSRPPVPSPWPPSSLPIAFHHNL